MSELTYSEVTGITDWIVSRLGYPVVTVELSASQLTYAVNEAIERHSAIITDWTIENNIADLLGLSSAQEFTQKWVQHDVDFARQFTDAYSMQAGVGGSVPFQRDYFVLSADTQFYTIPSGRVVSELFWQEHPALATYDINYLYDTQYWTTYEFGWAIYGYQLNVITPLYYNIAMMQSFEMRNRLRLGTKTYRITKDLNGNNEVWLTPVPTNQEVDQRVWYFYLDESLYNEKFSGSMSGMYVTDPSTVNYKEIAYSAFNSSAQRWVKDAALAIAKQTLGRIRSKFNTLPIPDAEVTLDGKELIDEGKEELDKLKEMLIARLEKMTLTNLIERDTKNAENLNKALGYHPTKIYIG